MQSVRGVAASTKDRELQDKICDCALEVMDKSANLIDEAKKAVNNPSNPDNQTRLAQVRRPTIDTWDTSYACEGKPLSDLDTRLKYTYFVSRTK